MITVESTSKTIAGNTLWHDLTLQLAPHTMTAIAGESGCGKTTLLNCIGCIDTVSTGRIWLGDVDTTGVGHRARRRLRAHQIGYLFQDYALIDNDSVYENVRVAMHTPRRRRSAYKVIDDALGTVGLTGRGRSKPHQLSGGQQQRVALARVIVRNPPVVLADEPTGALDHGNAAMVINTLRTFARDGATVVIATHDQWVQHQCDRTVTLGHVRAAHI